ncbi:MAG TPA: hypothetical protein VHL53_01645, partial [Acidimicrobiia bacterium]|nr:hypothetical protein [Acidimicrobiia bacterium]
GLLVPAGNLPGAVAGGLGLAALTTVGKLATGWWAAGRLGVAGAGRRRAGLTLVPKGELAVALALLAGQSAPERGPGSGLAALVATVIVLTSAVAPAIAAARRPGWYRWAVPTPAAARPEPPGT